MKNITNFDLELLKDFKTIYVLVSGGIDSTYLIELISDRYPSNTVAVNCYNPYEQSSSLKTVLKNYNSIVVQPNKKYLPGGIIRKAFLNIPKAIELRKNKKYSKKVFGCCRVFKHNMFKKDKRFQEPNTVVISGIKFSDGNQRRLFLNQLQTGKWIIGTSNTVNNYYGYARPTFFHTHKFGATYCYPFRDYTKEIPQSIINDLKIKYPTLDHSGCSICPVLLVFEDRIRKNATELDLKRIERSKLFYNKLK